MIIYNKYIPFNGYKAMAIYPFIFVRGSKVSDKTINHENIHFKQQIELLIIFFWVIYLIFWILYGYNRNPFEREANNFEFDFKYLKNREAYSWLKYLT